MGAAGAVLLAYAVARILVKDFFRPVPNCSDEQMQYMRDVRERNRAWAWEDAFGDTRRGNGRDGKGLKRENGGGSGGPTV